VADAFTRGCIAVTRRSKDFVLGAGMNNGAATADDARSQGSKTSKRSGKSGVASESLGGKKGGKKALGDVKVPDTVTEEDKDDKDALSPRQSIMEQEEEHLRALLKRRAEKEAAVEKERLDHEQKSKSIIEALAKVGVGKEILLDANGKPIPVTQMEVEKVPSKFVAPKTVCLEPLKDKGDAKPKHSSPKADPPPLSSFTPMGAAQPSAIETLGASHPPPPTPCPGCLSIVCRTPSDLTAPLQVHSSKTALFSPRAATKKLARPALTIPNTCTLHPSFTTQNLYVFKSQARRNQCN
jgi:hypothetical protein